MANLCCLDDGLIYHCAKNYPANLGKDLRDGIVTIGLTRKRRNKNAIVIELGESIGMAAEV